MESSVGEKVRALRDIEFRDKPQPELLIRIENRNKGIDYEVQTTTGEFTSLCPLAPSQPDYAKVSISYRPNDWLVELKSLKFYLVSYRQALMFHEEVANQILKDLVSLLEPRELVVSCSFTTRGGIDTEVEVEYAEG